MHEIVPALREEFGYKNVMQVPRVTKVTLNMGVGEGIQDAKAHGRGRQTAWPDHRAEAPGAPGAQVGGQLQAPRRHAGRAAGHPARRPHVRDARPAHQHRAAPHPGLPGHPARQASTARATTTWACKEQIIFPEIDYDKIDRVRGLDIAITTTAKTDDEGRALLKLAGHALPRELKDRSTSVWQRNQ